MSNCPHKNFIPGLDALLCKDCRQYFQEGSIAYNQILRNSKLKSKSKWLRQTKKKEGKALSDYATKF